MNKKLMLILFLLLTAFCISTSFATSIDSDDAKDVNQDVVKEIKSDDSNNVEIVDKNDTNIKTNNNKEVKANTNENNSINLNESLEGYGCSSVVLQVSNTESAISFRRDTQNKATIYIVNDSKLLRQYKIGGSEFTHVLVSADGWIVGSGGGDNREVDQKVISISKDMIKNNKITTSQINNIANLKKRIVVAHYVIKSPTGSYATVVYSNGKTSIQYGTLKSGEYLIVPNSHSYYKKSNIETGNVKKYKDNATLATRYLALTDRYGVNRRQITTFHYKQHPGYSDVYITATNDDGSYAGRKTGRLADDIKFQNKLTSAGSLPTGMNGKYIGTVTFKYNSPYLSKIATSIDIKLNQSEVYVTDMVSITATLKDNNSNPLANQTLQFTMDKTYNIRTNENGEINYIYKLTSLKNKTFKVSYAGRDIYANTSTNYTIKSKLSSVRIIEENNTRKLGTNSIFRAKVIADNVNQTINSGKAVLKINGKTFGRTNVKNGIMEFSIYLSPEGFGGYNYKVEYVYGGNTFTQMQRLKSVTTVTAYTPIITIDKIETSPNKEISIQVRVQNDTKGAIHYARSGNVGIKLNGITYKVNDKPVILKIVNATATFKLKLPDKYKGVYDITITYSGNSQFKSGRYTEAKALLINKY